MWVSDTEKKLEWISLGVKPFTGRRGGGLYCLACGATAYPDAFYQRICMTYRCSDVRCGVEQNAHTGECCVPIGNLPYAVACRLKRAGGPSRLDSGTVTIMSTGVAGNNEVVRRAVSDWELLKDSRV